MLLVKLIFQKSFWFCNQWLVDHQPPMPHSMSCKNGDSWYVSTSSSLFKCEDQKIWKQFKGTHQNALRSKKNLENVFENEIENIFLKNSWKNSTSKNYIEKIMRDIKNMKKICQWTHTQGGCRQILCMWHWKGHGGMTWHRICEKNKHFFFEFFWKFFKKKSKNPRFLQAHFFLLKSLIRTWLHLQTWSRKNFLKIPSRSYRQSSEIGILLMDFNILPKFGRFGGLGIEKMRRFSANCQNQLDKRRFFIIHQKSAFI